MERPRYISGKLSLEVFLVTPNTRHQRERAYEIDKEIAIRRVLPCMRKLGVARSQAEQSLIQFP
jgi:hypothetical protein